MRPRLPCAQRLLPALLLACACACADADRPTPTPEAGAVDKAALFADPGLVPTREGERARRELALAGELRRALEVLGFESLHVDVELGRESTTVLVSGRAPERFVAKQAELELEVEALARALVPDGDAATIHLWLDEAELRAAPRTEPSEPSPRTSLALALALLGLGVSVGLSFERVRQRLVRARG